jgi:hypothetical protein
MGEHALGASNAGSAGADNNNLDAICALVDHSQRIAEGSKQHDCGSVLVVVEYRDVELAA